MDLYLEQKPRRVTLDETQIRDVAISQLSMMRKLDGITDHEGGRWIYEWHDTGHGSGLTKYIQVATELDEAIELVLGELLDSRANNRVCRGN